MWYTFGMSFLSLFITEPKRSTAFSFDNGTLRWVSLIRAKGAGSHGEVIQVETFGSERFGPDVLGDDEKNINDAAFVARLRTLAPKVFGDRTNNPEATVVIPDRQAVMFHTHVTKAPDQAERAMDDIIVDHIKTYCQANNLLQLAEYICEYDVILETPAGYDIHVTLVPKLYVSHLTRLFKQANITVKHIETAHHAVARSCFSLPNGSGYVAVSFGERKTSVSLIHGEHLVSHDVLPVGVENLYRIIERFLNVERKDSLRIIQRHGILQTHPDNGLLSELYLELSPIFRSVDRQLIDLGQLPYKTFGQRFATRELVAYGEGVWVKGLIGFLGERTGLTVHELDVWAGHHDDRAPILNLPASETLTYAEALSLALLYLK